MAWYKQSVGFGWQAVIRNQASASNPIPQADCYLSPPFNSCKLRLLPAGGRGWGEDGDMWICSCVCVYAFVNTWLPVSECVFVGVFKLGHVSTLHQCRPAAAGR